MDWDARYRALAASRPPPDQTVTTIPVTELVVGDHLLWGGKTFTTDRCERVDLWVEVHAANEQRELTVDYLAIEQVTVERPRPLQAPNRKAPHA